MLRRLAVRLETHEFNLQTSDLLAMKLKLKPWDKRSITSAKEDAAASGLT